MPLAFAEHASVGSPITRLNVSLFPVYIHQIEIDVVGRSGKLIISERTDAEVPTIEVHNDGDHPVLLVEGETVEGGRQQRTLNVSVLVGAHSRLDLPVSCVEQGRWHGSNEFTRGRSFAPRRVRRAKHATVEANLREGGIKATDQSQIWAAVHHELGRHHAVAATGALNEIDAVVDRSTELTAAVRDLVGRGPLPGQTGVVISHGSRVVAAELFATAQLLVEHWEPLVRAALLDAPARATGAASATRALRFLHRFSTGAATETAGVGLGREHHVRTTRLVGQALILNDLLVHASAFALAG